MCSGDSQFSSAVLIKENLEDALAQALNSISNQATSNPDTSHRVPHPTSVTSRETDPPHLNPSSIDSYEQAIFINPSRREVAGHFYIDPESYPLQVYELRHSTGLITSPVWPTGLPETTVVTELSVQFISGVISLIPSRVTIFSEQVHNIPRLLHKYNFILRLSLSPSHPAFPLTALVSKHPVKYPFVMLIEAAVLLNRAIKHARLLKAGQYDGCSDDFALAQADEFRTILIAIGCFQ